MYNLMRRNYDRKERKGSKLASKQAWPQSAAQPLLSGCEEPKGLFCITSSQSYCFFSCLVYTLSLGSESDVKGQLLFVQEFLYQHLNIRPVNCKREDKQRNYRCIKYNRKGFKKLLLNEWTKCLTVSRTFCIYFRNTWQ